MTTITSEIVEAFASQLTTYSGWTQAPSAISPGATMADEELVKTGPFVTLLLQEERHVDTGGSADKWELIVAIEAHKYVPAGGNAQAIGMAMVGELRAAVLPAGETYLAGLIKSGSLRPVSSGVDLPESGERTVAGRLVLSVNYIEKRNNIIY